MGEGKNIVIDPVTRVEGHGKIVIRIDDDGKVADSFFGVTEFRGFEKFCEGRMLWDMPTLTNRICGFCPVSHHLASVKACEALLGVEIPPAAKKLRELLHMGQIIHSHSLHFFFCALPDTLFPDHENRSNRNLFGLMDMQRGIATSAIRIRKAGQDIVDIVGGGRLHPVACIPGGLSKELSSIERMEMLKGILSTTKIARQAVRMIKELHGRTEKTFRSFAAFPGMFMGMVKNGNLELYDAPLRLIDEQGDFVTEFNAADYQDVIEEHVAPTSWTKFPYFKKKGFPEGAYRVAPLARLNICENISTPLADAELKEFKKIGNGKPIEGSLYYHYARMIELLYAMERARELLNDPEILSHEVRVPVRVSGGEGVGVLEAPRGPLFHHYQADEDGRIRKVNLIVATAHNNEAMNRGVRMTAEKIVVNGEIPEKDLNRLEMAIRCFDPCLSCSSHAYGHMPLEIRIVDSSGSTVSQYRYGDF